MKNIILGLGWIIFALFLVSGYFYKKFSIPSDSTEFIPISWESHKQIFNGVVQCSLIPEDLNIRKEELKKSILSKVVKRKEVSNGIIFYFNNEPNLLESVLEHIIIERQCCPFFKFDVSILPFNKGFALQISGSEDAIEMIKEYELEIDL